MTWIRYLQETGRAGRDGNAGSALLYYGANDIAGTNVTQQMHDYCNLKDSCRRAFLLQDFDADEHPPVRSASVVTLYPIMQLC